MTFPRLVVGCCSCASPPSSLLCRNKDKGPTLTKAQQKAAIKAQKKAAQEKKVTKKLTKQEKAKGKGKGKEDEDDLETILANVSQAPLSCMQVFVLTKVST
jgi:hypothetical protein